MSQEKKIRGIDYVTIEVYGLMQNYSASIEECQSIIEMLETFDRYNYQVLNHQQDTGYIDVALYPKDEDKRKFIKNLKEDGYIE